MSFFTKILGVALASSLLLPASASASRWALAQQHAVSSNNGTYYWMNMDALSQKREMASTWIARVTGNGTKHDLSFVTFDCKRSQYRLNEVFAYKNLRITSHKTQPGNWRKAGDSRMRNMLNMACLLEGIPLEAIRSFEDIGEMFSYSTKMQKEKILKATDCVNKPNPF